MRPTTSTPVGQEGKAQALVLLYRYLVQQATVAAYRDYFMVIAVLGLATIPLVWLIKEHERSRSHPGECRD